MFVWSVFLLFSYTFHLRIVYIFKEGYLKPYCSECFQFSLILEAQWNQAWLVLERETSRKGYIEFMGVLRLLLLL